MKTIAPILASLLLASAAFAQERPWQQISDPTAAQLAANFAAPPSAYGSQFDWGFSDSITREAMAGILDHARSLGVMCAFVEPKAGKRPLPLAGIFCGREDRGRGGQKTRHAHLVR